MNFKIKFKKFNWCLFFSGLINKPKSGMNLKNYNFSNYKVIKTPTSWKNADLSFSYGLHGNINFQSFDKLNLSYVNFRNVTSIKFNPYATEINLSWTEGLYGQLEFSCVGKVSLCNADMTTVFKLHGAKETNLKNAQGLVGFLDFKDTYYLNMSGTDVSNAKLRFNPNAKKINLINVKGLSGVLDFGNTERIVLFGADLSNVTKIICGPNTDLIGVANFAGKIEFSTSKQLSQKIAGTKSIYRHQARNEALKRLHTLRQITGKHK